MVCNCKTMQNPIIQRNKCITRKSPNRLAITKSETTLAKWSQCRQISMPAERWSKVAGIPSTTWTYLQIRLPGTPARLDQSQLITFKWTGPWHISKWDPLSGLLTMQLQLIKPMLRFHRWVGWVARRTTRTLGQGRKAKRFTSRWASPLCQGISHLEIQTCQLFRIHKNDRACWLNINLSFRRSTIIKLSEL